MTIMDSMTDKELDSDGNFFFDKNLHVKKILSKKIKYSNFIN
jgi:hypothetical protein